MRARNFKARYDDISSSQVSIVADLVSAKLHTLRTLRTCAPLTSLLIAAEAPQSLVCAIRAPSRPAGRQTSRTPPARVSTLYRKEAPVLPRGPAPALARRRCQHGAGSRRQCRYSTPCSTGPGCLTSSSPCSHRGAATPME